MSNDLIYRDDVFKVLDEVSWLTQEDYERIHFLIYSIQSVESHEAYAHVTNEIELLKLENELLKNTLHILSNIRNQELDMGDIDNDNCSES